MYLFLSFFYEIPNTLYLLCYSRQWQRGRPHFVLYAQSYLGEMNENFLSFANPNPNPNLEEAARKWRRRLYRISHFLSLPPPILALTAAWMIWLKTS